MKRMTNTLALAAALLLAGTSLAGTYGWNIGSGTWDTNTVNWIGSGTQWVDSFSNDALFTNTATATTIAVSGSRTGGVVRVGNGSNNAKFTFTNGTLFASAIVVVASGSNGQDAGSSTPTMFSNATVNVSGNVVVGHWTLAIGGNSIVNVGGVIGGSYSGIDGTWGYLTIRDSAVVTATGGVDGNNLAWSLNLNGGTLIAKSVRASDREAGGGIARMTFNGTTLKPTQDTNSFVTVGADVGATSSALVGNGGAIFDTDGKSIGIKINLKVSGSGGLTKLGAGTLTLSGTNTYSGATLVSNGMLKASALALPSGTSVTVAETAVLELSGASQTVSNLSGKGVVSNGILTVTGLVQPGGTNAIGTLTVPTGTVLTGKLLVDAAADGTSDLLAVQGGVSLASATLEVAATATLNTSMNYTLLTCVGTPAHFASISVPAGWLLRYMAGAVMLVPGSAVTYSWNTGNGTWDTTSANWVGAATLWTDNMDALFTNTASASAITVDGPRMADTVKVGNGTNNAAYTFANGPLSTYSLLVQGAPGNSKYAAGIGITTLDNLILTNTGNLTVSSWTLSIGGFSTVNVGGVIGGANWGTLAIKDSAVVTAPNGVNGTAEAWMLNLNGGTLVTKGIRASDRETVGSEARLTFNGTVVKPTQSTNDFVTVGYNDLSTSSALVGNGGAIFDTDGKNLGLTISLKQSGSGGLTKLGAGALTLIATNHTYAGATTISGGSLVVSSDNPSTNSVPIANASFEKYDGATLLPSGGTTAYRFVPTGASWIFSAQAGIATSNSYFMVPVPGSDGFCAGYLYGAETISQTVTVSTAGLYDLRFMANKGRNYFFNSLAVKIDGTSVCSYASSTIATDGFKTFEAKSLALPVGAHVLLFQCFDPQSIYVNGLLPATVIDRVTLIPAAGGSLPSGTAVNITASGALYVQGRSSQTVGSLAGVAGSIVSNNGVLTVGSINTNTAFAGVISGPGSLVKTGAGTLTLSGSNTYTGVTTVAVGTLEMTASNTLTSNSVLEIATGAFVKLSNASELQVATLTFNSVPQYRGTWGSPASMAEHKRAQFVGTGVLRVLKGLVSPGTMLLLN